MTWTPHATVAVVIEQEGRYLLVKELSEDNIVYNQPAGHIEENESIFDAATRETLEESGYEIELNAIVGLYTYKAPSNGVTYYRICFEGRAIRKKTDVLDADILSAHWLTYDEIKSLEQQGQLRSPLVINCIDDFRSAPRLPLSFIKEFNH
ncbi:NUDIX hydrolase [Alkalimarinus sediminis]|uniref:Phosphatase NudJ n=1 Tax=Alkalimarinus sediminis TaxID=1632866 RepID=A0A9E8KRI8_9ALTE|nr:NUDIX hydrolase [Alkalimarinus sediminis]UZW76117.1 NUDIX hydrolase [Alkalimarinus sediminis]